MIDRDTVVRLAKEAGLTNATIHSLSIFAALIANETLEIAAKACESRVDPEWPSNAESIQYGICADAIRALKE